MEQFVDDDAGYLGWLEKHPDSFVVNTYRRPRASYLRLHGASCRLITGTPANGSMWTRHYSKRCGTEAELRTWAKQEFGSDLWECPRCIERSQ